MTNVCIRLGELVDRCGGHLIGSKDICIAGIAPLSNASDQHITFLSNPKLRNQAALTKAAAIILTESDFSQIGDQFSGAC
ncbi:MAG: UDP-3-O-(3-hydroxymyristoyl)glucosamine N-acyltransferase, partial [Burkholderiales bacterium]|nr:UDP-3-O-(3-hydroxymyristoyl)glucosamine N-acyltransferase [Burkholderiales bacterium]